VYALHGFVGYQIDLEFEPGESFLGLGAGDIEGLTFIAQDNHLFLKPRAGRVATNLTVLTTRRHYHFDYWATTERPEVKGADVIYALRFLYPPTVTAGDVASGAARSVETALNGAPEEKPKNFDYWYCGSPALKPIAAWDNGVHTRLRFGPKAELPAIFVRNDDGSESLLNFHVEEGEIIVHRVVRHFILRRGTLGGCIVNKDFHGIGERLDSGTVSPKVQRERKSLAP
jgi:type IV secretion system protein VirB9